MSTTSRTAPSSNGSAQAESSLGKPQLLWWANWLLSNLETATDCLSADDDLLERLETMGPGLKRFKKALEDGGIQPEAPLTLAAKAEEWFREQTELRLQEFQQLLTQAVSTSTAPSAVATVRPSKQGAPTVNPDEKMREITMREQGVTARENSLQQNLSDFKRREQDFAETKRRVTETDAQLKTREADLKRRETELEASQKDGDTLLNMAIADVDEAVKSLKEKTAAAQALYDETIEIRNRLITMGVRGMENVPTPKPVPEAEPYKIFSDGMTWEEISSWPADNNSPKAVRELVQRAMSDRQRSPRGITHETIGLTWAEILKEIQNASSANMRKLKLHLSQRRSKIRRSSGS